MSDKIRAEVDATILKLENAANDQHQLDNLWVEIKALLLNEIDTLPDLPVSNNKNQNKLFRKSQPFWNENLKIAWFNVCKAEKEYLLYNARLNNNPQQKACLRDIYKNAQRCFDSKYRYFKRKYRKSEYDNLEKLAESSPNEMWIKLKKLSNPSSTRAALEIVRDDGTISHDIKEILNRWHNDIGKLFSGFRDNPDFAFDEDFYGEVLDKKREFENLTVDQQDQQSSYDNKMLNEPIRFQEVSEAVDKAKSRKAFIEIPNEAIKNENAKLILHKLFQLCFITGLSPSEWNSSNIKPIPKKDKDARYPLENRCITLMCCIAKLYSSILNRRLQKYLEKNNILVEEQNGFRASRSCIDHILTLCTILRNRKSLGLSTFLSYIDFQKAFDSVDRNLMFYKLSQIGVTGRFYGALQAMYKNPRSKILLNEFETAFFNCPIGVKQGDNISAMLFSIFINDLAEEIKNTKVGINLTEKVDNEGFHDKFHDFFINILLYADDIILLTSNENDLQFLLNIVENWCHKWRLEVNLTKTNIMHVRNPRCPQSRFMFLFNYRVVSYCRKYTYLGTTLDEFLNFQTSADSQAEAAGRALGSLISKTIKNGGLPYKIFSMLYECAVCAVADYGSEIWGYEAKDSSNKIQLRAARCFLGVPKHATSAGVLAEISWLEPVYRTQIRMIRQYFRILKMSDSRLTKRIYLWDKSFFQLRNTQSWSSEVRDILLTHNLGHVFEPTVHFCQDNIIDQLKRSMNIKQNVDLKRQCLEKPKLRNYVHIKDFNLPSPYLTIPMPFVCRKYLALTRLSNLQIRIETARFERPKIDANFRFCQVGCGGLFVEDEYHILFICNMYNHLRFSWLSKIKHLNIFLTCIQLKS